jgi:hypothetical protein
MKGRLNISVLALLGLLAACEQNPTEPPEGFPHALATPACGPVDQALVAIYLAAAPIESSQPAVPFVQITVPGPLTELRAGQNWSISEDYSQGTAWRFYGGTNAPITANQGDVAITEVSSTMIRGSVNLRFMDGSRIRGTFDAAWHPLVLFCG